VRRLRIGGIGTFGEAIVLVGRKAVLEAAVLAFSSKLTDPVVISGALCQIKRFAVSLESALAVTGVMPATLPARRSSPPAEKL
jgi:hypothetical protein